MFLWGQIQKIPHFPLVVWKKSFPDPKKSGGSKTATPYIGGGAIVPEPTLSH